MKVLELMHSLEEAYDRFGDIDIKIIKVAIIQTSGNTSVWGATPKELIIESEEFIIKCE